MGERVIVSTNAYSDEIVDFIARFVRPGFCLVPAGHLPQGEFVDTMSQADYLLAGGRRRIDESALSQAHRLRMVQRTGVGLDSIDLKYLKERGIPLYVNRGVNARSVAEHTLALMLACLRDVVSNTQELRSGVWVKQERGIRNHELGPLTVGIVGLGRIGEHVVRLVQAFGSEVVYYDSHRRGEEDEAALGVRYLPFDQLLSTAQVISVHCPLTPETRHLFCREAFSRMREGCVFINTSRGALVDEFALCDALAAGRVAAAGLDVYESEPLGSDSMLLSLPNVTLTSHIAGITADSFAHMMDGAMHNIACFDAGELSRIERSRVI